MSPTGGPVKMGKQGSQFSGFTSQAKGGSSKSIKHNLKLKFIIMDMFFFLLLLFCSYHRDKLLWTFFFSVRYWI